MISEEDLYRDLPKEFWIYFDRIRSLDSGETPAHTSLRKVFRNLFVWEGFDRDRVSDWTFLKYLMGPY